MRFTWKRAPASMESHQPHGGGSCGGPSLAALAGQGAATIWTFWVRRLLGRPAPASGVSTIHRVVQADAGDHAVLGMDRGCRGCPRTARRPGRRCRRHPCRRCPTGHPRRPSDQPALGHHAARMPQPSTATSFPSPRSRWNPDGQAWTKASRSPTNRRPAHPPRCVGAGRPGHRAGWAADGLKPVLAAP